MLKFKKLLHQPNFTFSKHGWLCVSFQNSDFLTPKVQPTFRVPVDFYLMIKEGIELPMINRLFKLTHQLIEQYDDNFDLPTKR